MMLWSVIPAQLARLIFSAFGASSRHVTPASTPFQQKKKKKKK